MTQRSLVVCTLAVAVALAWGSSGLDLGHGVGLDAVLLNTAHFYRIEDGGLGWNDAAIERIVALVGLTGRVGSIASLRVSGDVSILQPQDLYVDLRWPSGFGLRVGQFVVPLGTDVMTEPGQQMVVNNLSLAWNAKPAGIRDVGVMGGWDGERLSAAVAVVNGAGANAGDDNDRKDLGGRAAVRPFEQLGLTLALQGYYGWPAAADSAWQMLGAEASLARGPLAATAELQDQAYGAVRRDAAYLQLGYALGWVQPCARIDMGLLNGQGPDLMFTAGANLRMLSGHIRVAPNGFYRRNFKEKWAVYGVMFRLQAEL